MKWIMVASLLLIPQESSPVPALLERIDGRDPKVCFRAISELADLGAAHRREIEKGADHLPAFYRDALLAEMKWPPLAQKRVTLKGKRNFRQQLKEMERQTGEKIDLGFLDRSPSFEFQHDGEFSADCSEVTAMEAMAEACGAFGAFIERDELSDQIKVTDFGGKLWVAGQRSLIVFHEKAWMRKWIDFSGRAEWQSGLRFTAFMRAGVRVQGWKDVRVVEAVSDKGVDLRLNPEAERPSFLDFPTGQEEPSNWDQEGFIVSLRLPTGVEMASRLKISAVAQVFTRYWSVKVNTKGTAGNGKASNDGLEVEVRPCDPRDEQGRTYTLRLRARGLSGKELAGRSRVIRSIYCGKEGWADLKLRSIEGDTLEFDARWENIGGVLKGELDQKTLEEVTIYVADGLEEKPVFVEFRDIPLR